MAGYLKNKYVNVQYPWDGHEDPQEPNVPENNHVAIYRRSFTLDRPLAATLENGGTVSITFHGMATAIYVWVNGTFVGYGEDGFTPNEFDITEALNVDGDNVLTVACYEYASASWLEDQDFWRLVVFIVVVQSDTYAGIFMSVIMRYALFLRLLVIMKTLFCRLIRNSVYIEG